MAWGDSRVLRARKGVDLIGLHGAGRLAYVSRVVRLCVGVCFCEVCSKIWRIIFGGIRSLRFPSSSHRMQQAGSVPSLTERHTLVRTNSVSSIPTAMFALPRVTTKPVRFMVCIARAPQMQTMHETMRVSEKM